MITKTDVEIGKALSDSLDSESCPVEGPCPDRFADAMCEECTATIFAEKISEAMQPERQAAKRVLEAAENIENDGHTIPAQIWHVLQNLVL